jgi:hypothetical protein
VSDSGGAYTSDAFEAVCGRLEIDHKTIVSTQGESYLNWIEPHFNIPRRLDDSQFSLAHTPRDLAQRHPAFIHTYNTTAHQGLLTDQRLPPIPVEILGTAQGRRYPQEGLAEKFAHALFPRTTNRYGCVTLHSYHVSREAGIPKSQVLLWVYGEQRRAVLDHVVLAEYRCRYDGQARKGTDSHPGTFYATRVASPQEALILLNPQEALGIYRPRAPRRLAFQRFPRQQLVLFERVLTGEQGTAGPQA